MSPKPHRNRLVIFLLLIIVILLIVLGITCNRCHWHLCNYCKPKPDTIAWGSRNILFKPGTSMSTKAGVIALIDSSLRQELVGSGIDTSLVHLILRPWFCPCDSNLINVDYTLIDESGNPIPPPPPSQPPTTAMGGSVFGSTLNATLATPEYYSGRHLLDSIPAPDAGQQTSKFHIDSKSVLAVIDTGVDTAAINKYLPGSLGTVILWQDPSGKPTLYNTIPFAQPLPNHELWYDDDELTKHGSTVTYIALQASKGNSPQVNTPQIMVLKALDSLGRGTVFSVSCAMSYALHHGASLINASLGYSGPEDPILRSYFDSAEIMKIPVMVAAGNDNTPNHNRDSVCTTVVNHRDSLTEDHPFYPAFFAESRKYVISITGMSSDSLPCYYQHFSNRYSDFAAWLTSPSSGSCCSFFAPFLHNGSYVEGSSYSTPVYSGLLGFYLATGLVNFGAGSTADPKTFLMSHTFPAPRLSKYVRSSQYTPFIFFNVSPNQKPR